MESQELTADQFAIPFLFQRILSELPVHKGAIVVAQDATQTQLKSAYLDRMVDSTNSLNKINPRLITRRRHVIPVQTDFPTILPAELDPYSHDLYCQRPDKLKPRSPTKIIIPPFNVNEVRDILKFYKSADIISRSN